MSKNTRYVFELANDEKGTVLPLFGLMSMIAIAAVGGAIDYGRAYQLRSKLQNSMDAAVVSGMSIYDRTGDWTQAMAHTNANFNAQFAVTNHQHHGVTAPVVEVTNDGTKMIGTASVQANTPFWKLVMGQNLDVGAISSGELTGTSSANRKKVEVALMVDLTGSMGQTVGSTGTKISSLRQAGLDLVDILLPTSGANDSVVKVGIAPFADYVNAGEYAAAATGLAATGGAYSNMTNLASTRQGVFSGTYSGLTGNQQGSQAGATPPAANTGTSVPAGGTASGGGTFSNQYCAVTTQVQTTVNTMTTTNYGTAPIGSPANSYTSYSQGGNTITVAWGAYYWQSNSNGNSNNGNTWYYISNVGSQNGRSYGNLYRRNGNSSNWYLYDNQYYYNNYVATTSTQTVTVPGCENNSVQQASSKLISCVTERKTSLGALDFTAAASSMSSRIGSYGRGISTIANYSSDGKCYTAGRELPAIVPLTNTKSTITSFFNGPNGSGPQIGGATPGHLGTAWTSYLLSPEWSSVWPGREGVAYTDTGTKKFAILMTDGEYNVHYASQDSASQALAICTEMKSKGITVITVGFGFPENAVSQATPSATGTAGQRAMHTLQQCASPAAPGASNNYYFPYDGNALRTTFQNIGNSVAATTTTTTINRAGRLTN